LNGAPYYTILQGLSPPIDASDEELKDIGIEPPKRDFDAVKPFWMP